jgi:hypothetical protein
MKFAAYGGGMPEIEFLKSVSVMRLPYPGGIEGPACMVRRRRLPERLWRQWRPRPPSDCCLYHQGDWRELSETAIRLVEAATAEGLSDVEAISEYVEEARDQELHAEGQYDMWKSIGVGSLVSLGLAIQPGGGGEEKYYEGRHRVIAMIDAGVRRTIVLQSRPNPDWVE